MMLTNKNQIVTVIGQTKCSPEHRCRKCNTKLQLRIAVCESCVGCVTAIIIRQNRLDSVGNVSFEVALVVSLTAVLCCRSTS